MAPMRYKWSVVKAWSIEYMTLVLAGSFFHESMVEGKSILEDNQYPSWFYEEVIHDTLEKIILKKEKHDFI